MSTGGCQRSQHQVHPHLHSSAHERRVGVCSEKRVSGRLLVKGVVSWIRSLEGWVLERACCLAQRRTAASRLQRLVLSIPPAAATSRSPNVSEVNVNIAASSTGPATSPPTPPAKKSPFSFITNLACRTKTPPPHTAPLPFPTSTPLLTPTTPSFVAVSESIRSNSRNGNPYADFHSILAISITDCTTYGIQFFNHCWFISGHWLTSQCCCAVNPDGSPKNWLERTVHPRR